MSQLDPNILKRNLPEDIHAAIDQVDSNVDLAVNEVVNKFKAFANGVADKFEQGQFEAELQGKLDAIQQDLNTDLDRAGSVAANLKDLAKQADEAASKADMTKLSQVIGDLSSQADDLTKKLAEFRTKTTTFAQKTGGFIASAAVKTFTGGIG